MLKTLRDRRGFGGQPDLLIIVAIIGIIAAIAIPKFAELIRKANEGACKGNLGAMRSALSIFYGDTLGRYPYHPSALLFGKRYLNAIPKAKTPNYHPDSDNVRIGASSADTDDSGGWLYVGDPSSKERGAFLVNCTHTDTKGSAWTSY
ncbi:MAG TPA: hypothetical protein DCM05_11570 [Elusimicrobia bacterium]|nr:hypothetical protein [Elusimicrobiota bacterium]